MLELGVLRSNVGLALDAASQFAELHSFSWGPVCVEYIAKLGRADSAKTWSS